jgi:hypothetical protein
MMEKTWEVKEKELREEIAKKIEKWKESSTTTAVYDALQWAAAIARGTKMSTDEIDARCSRCSKVTVIHKQDLRTPYYCLACK